MANKPLETPKPSAFLPDGLSPENLNVPISPAMKCKALKCGGNCTIFHLQPHLLLAGGRNKLLLNVEANGPAGMYDNVCSLRERWITSRFTFSDSETEGDNETGEEKEKSSKSVFNTRSRREAKKGREKSREYEPNSKQEF